MAAKNRRQTCREAPVKTITVKVVEYRLLKGVDERAFLAASAKLMPALSKLPGFIMRELHKGESGRWRDVVYWKTRADADHSELDIPRIPVCMKCIAAMDQSGITVKHFELVQKYTKMEEA